MSRATHKFEKRTAWKGTALLLPLIFIIGCNAVNKQPLHPGEPDVWIDSDGHGITWASPSSDRVGHFVKYTDGPYKGKVYLTHRDNQNRNYIQRDGEKVYVYHTGTYYMGIYDMTTQEAWPASDGYEMEWAYPPPGMSMSELYVKYTDGPYKGKVYQVHKDERDKGYIQRDGEKVYLSPGPTYYITSEAWGDSDRYTIGWAFPPPGMPRDERYVEYGDGPYKGKVYQVHYDEQRKGYIQRGGEKVYINRTFPLE